MRDPGKYFLNNVGHLINLLNAMVKHQVLRFVFSSSAGVYGEPEKTPIEEDAPLAAVNPYGESKAIGERLLRWYDSQCGLRYVSLRYFNAAGATESLGEDHRPETHLIPVVLEVAGRQAARRSRSTAPTTRRPTAPASATTFTSPTWRRRTRWRWSGR